MCSEFRTLIRQELDVEDLLRTALEYLLVKTGPTNAAVYLAGGDDSFGLGAYVNCDLPRKSVEPMLRRLCDEACPAVAEHVDVLRFEDAKEFVSDCELGAEVSEDIEMVAVPCHHDGECFAVMFLFRDSEQGFEDETAQVLGALRSILAEQLATLIRVGVIWMGPCCSASVSGFFEGALLVPLCLLTTTRLLSIGTSLA
jgi:GAF domain-containing protein